MVSSILYFLSVVALADFIGGAFLLTKTKEAYYGTNKTSKSVNKKRF